MSASSSADQVIVNGRRKVSGFTILEILITAAVMVIFFGMVFSFLLPSMRVYALGSTRAEIQQEALRVLDKMSIDLGQSVFAGVTLSLPAVPANGPIYLGVMRLADVDDQGKQLWQQDLVVYCWEGPGKPIVRKVWRTGIAPLVVVNFNAPTEIPNATLIAIGQEPTLQGQVLARDVASFMVDCTWTGTSSAPPMIVTFTISRIAATGRIDAAGNAVPENFTIQREIDLRNQI